MFDLFVRSAAVLEVAIAKQGCLEVRLTLEGGRCRRLGEKVCIKFPFPLIVSLVGQIPHALIRMDPETCRKGVTHTSQPPYITPMIPVQLEWWTSPLPSQSTLILADIRSMKPYRDTNISLMNGPEAGPLSDGVNESMKGRKTESMCGSIISRSRLPWHESRISQKIKSSNASIRQCLISMVIVHVFTECVSLLTAT